MICAIVLAAGSSRRMGTQKLLLPFGGKSVIARVVEELLRSAVDRVCAVVGRERGRIVAELRARPVVTAINPHPEEGMLSSVRRGLRVLPASCKGVLVALGDQPSLRAELVNRMISAFRHTGKGIVVPAHEGKRGHPILFSNRYRDEILTRYEETGLRGLLRSHPDDIFELNVPNAAVLSDMDFPEDYAREIASLQKGPNDRPERDAR